MPPAAGNDALRGGIDLGGTKIQAAIVSPTGEVSGEARRQTPTEGGPADVAAEMAKALVEAADAAGVQTDSLAGIGVGSPGDTNEETGDVSEARNLPGLGGDASRSGRRWRMRSGRRCGSATTSTSPPTPSSSSAPASPTTRSSASSGAPGSAAG